MDELQEQYTPVTQDNSGDVAEASSITARSPLEDGTDLVPGYTSNFQQGRVSNNIYFTTLVETAAWGGAVGSAALDGSPRTGPHLHRGTHGPVRGRPECDQQAVPGNPTHGPTAPATHHVSSTSSRTGRPFPGGVAGMLNGLARLREQGLDVIED